MEELSSSSEEDVSTDDVFADEVTEVGNRSRDVVAAPSTTPMRKTIRARQTAIQNPMLVDAMRKTRLGLKGREVTGKLSFTVPKSQLLDLPPTPANTSEQSRVTSAVSARETLCRRFESLHPSRKEDDASYYDAVEKGTEVTLITALPPGYERGGWRCHAKRGDCDQECLHANRAEDDRCTTCQSSKPNIRPEFAYLRLLPRGLHRQRNDYERIMRDCDDELSRCCAAEIEATERIAHAERDSSDQNQESDGGVASNYSAEKPAD